MMIGLIVKIHGQESSHFQLDFHHENNLKKSYTYIHKIYGQGHQTFSIMLTLSFNVTFAFKIGSFFKDIMARKLK